MTNTPPYGEYPGYQPPTEPAPQQPYESYTQPYPQPPYPAQGYEPYQQQQPYPAQEQQPYTGYAPPPQQQQQPYPPSYAPQYAPGPGYPPAGPTSGMAIASLVVSLLGIGLVAVILGHLALNEIKKSNGYIQGRGLAIAGLIIGYLQIAAGVAVLLFFVIGIIVAANTPTQ